MTVDLGTLISVVGGLLTIIIMWLTRSIARAHKRIDDMNDEVARVRDIEVVRADIRAMTLKIDNLLGIKFDE